jgi:hypothetical protein
MILKENDREQFAKKAIYSIARKNWWSLWPLASHFTSITSSFERELKPTFLVPECLCQSKLKISHGEDVTCFGLAFSKTKKWLKTEYWAYVVHNHSNRKTLRTQKKKRVNKSENLFSLISSISVWPNDEDRRGIRHAAITYLGPGAEST